MSHVWGKSNRKSFVRERPLTKTMWGDWRHPSITLNPKCWLVQIKLLLLELLFKSLQRLLVFVTTKQAVTITSVSSEDVDWSINLAEIDSWGELFKVDPAA